MSGLLAFPNIGIGCNEMFPPFKSIQLNSALSVAANSRYLTIGKERMSPSLMISLTCSQKWELAL